MTRDFTFDIYEQLLCAGHDAGYEHITVQEYVRRDSLPERFIIHRHDVDRKPGNARRMAEVEAKHDVRSTYYFRTIDKTLRPEIITEIEERGHEVGYHYEDMDRANGDRAEALHLFQEHLSELRQYATIETICMHGNPLTAYDNRAMWEENATFEEYDIYGEAYLSMDFEEVTYFSDTGRTWQDGALKIKDHTMGEGSKEVQVRGTDELISLVEDAHLEKLCLLSHPNRWADSFPEYVIELSKDTAINTVKRALTATGKR